MWHGSFQLGTYFEVPLQVLDGDRSPVLPDAVPSIEVRRDSDGAVVYSGLMPIIDKDDSPGMFRLPLFFGSGFAAGGHSFRLSSVVGGSPALTMGTFTIQVGGNPVGQAIGMEYLHKPHADFIVFQAESGVLLKGKNPRII